MPEEATAVINGAAKSSVMMSAMTRMPNMTRLQERMPILDQLPVAYFTGQQDDALRGPQATAAWFNKFIVAQEIAAVFTVPQNVIADSGYDIVSMVMPRIMESIGLAFDQAVAVGKNAPLAGSIWPECILTQAGVAIDPQGFGVAGGRNNEGHSNIVSLGGAASYTCPDGTVATTNAVGYLNEYQATAGKDIGTGTNPKSFYGGAFQRVLNMGYRTSSIMGTIPFEGALQGMTDTTGRPLLLNNGQSPIQGKPSLSIAGVPYSSADNGALESASGLLAIGGDLKQAVFSVRQDIDYQVTTEGVITDSTGKVLVNCFQQRCWAVVVWFRVGWQVPNPPSIVAAANNRNVNGSSTVRSPFWALVS